MEGQLHRTHGGLHEEPQHAGLHTVIEGEGEGEHHHEKKSVLKKVKAKAKKIKESIKHIGHEHEHGHDEDEEDDEDEEMEQDPEVHGALIYESSFITGTALPRQDVGLGPNTALNLENPTIKGEDRVDPTARDRDTIGRFFQGQGQEHLGQTGASFAKPTAMDTHVPEHRRVPPASGAYGTGSIAHPSHVRGQEGNVGEPGVRLGAPVGLERDPDAPKDRFEAMHPANYQSKVTDPTGRGGEEARIGELVSSLGKMEVRDDSETKPTSMGVSQHKPYTGSHDQFAPQHTSTESPFTPSPIPHNPSEASKNPEKIPKSFDASKAEETHHETVERKPSGQGGYTDKISSAASAITGKAISAKNVVASKLGYGGTEAVKSQAVHEGNPTEHQEHQDQGSYTEKIAYATSAIADKAAAAKNVVASKLGYTGTEGTRPHGTEPTTESTKSASPTDYAHKAAAAVTDTLAPVYGKVAGVGSAVMSKVPGVGTGTTHSSNEGKARETSEKGASMKDYLAEKFRPGEEDKALSAVISETLHKPKEKTMGESKPPIERVTESEEVARRLGTGEENRREGEDAVSAGSESSGKGVLDRITGAVSSWISKGGGGGGGSQTSQDPSPGNTFVNTKGSGGE